MRFSTLLATALASIAAAAPSYPQLSADALPRNLDTMSEYFNLLAAKVQSSRYTSPGPQCDMTKANMPIAPEPLPPVSLGLTLHHVAVGRGTQNYTCDAGNATAAPEAAGAVATLFNVSCVAATHPDLLNLIPAVSMQFDMLSAPLTATSPGEELRNRLGPDSAAYAGDHFFHDATTPFFHLQDSGRSGGGETSASETRIADVYTGLNSSTPAPEAAAVGRGGEPAVAWLKLLAFEPTTDDVREVYRLTTVGGSPPATCEDMEETFEVAYAAVYWFYSGPSPPEHEEDEDADDVNDANDD